MPPGPDLIATCGTGFCILPSQDLFDNSITDYVCGQIAAAYSDRIGREKYSSKCLQGAYPSLATTGGSDAVSECANGFCKYIDPITGKQGCLLPDLGTYTDIYIEVAST